jgi:hypothetical protein
MKKLKSIPVSCTDEDRELVDQCCKLQTTFPPSRSEMALLLIRDGAARLRRGDISLEEIYQTFHNSPTGDARAAGDAGGTR